MMDVLAVNIEGLTKTYKKGFKHGSVKAVDDLSLSIEQGTVMGFIGPNGAGKTTTIYCLLGLLIPDEGGISIFGHEPQSKEAQKRIGFQSEIFHTYNFLKPRAALRFYGQLSGLRGNQLDNKIDFQLTRLGLEDARNKKVGSFSKGMKQRLGLAQALLHDPNLLILDEPFTGLDPQGRKLIADIILEEKEKGKTVFFSSHILSDIERLCDRVTMIRNGEVIISENIKNITGHKNNWVVNVVDWKETYNKRVSECVKEINISENSVKIICSSENKNEVLQRLLDLPVEIIGVRPQSWTLEEQYIKMDREGMGNE